MKNLDAPSVYQGLLHRLVERSNLNQPRGIAIAITSVNHGEGVTYVTNSLDSALQAVLASRVLKVSLQALEGVRDDPSEIYTLSQRPAGESELPTQLSQQENATTMGLWDRGFESRRKLVQQLCSQFSVVLIDCPPLREGDNTLRAVPVVDGVILVVQAGVTTKADILFAERIIVDSGGTFEGHILNKAESVKYGWFNKYFSQRT